jgi:hypothetical protein
MAGVAVGPAPAPAQAARAVTAAARAARARADAREARRRGVRERRRCAVLGRDEVDFTDHIMRHAAGRPARRHIRAHSADRS